MPNNIGDKIKDLRLSKKMTLKELSEMTELSIGFLSQVERGLTALAITSLEKIARALDVDLSYFFPLKKRSNDVIMRSFEREVARVDSAHFIHYHLSNDLENRDILPRVIEILPKSEDELLSPYQHEGEEFIYVLEGIFTLYLNNERYELYPGDCAHFESSTVHNWANYTSKMVKVLCINVPNGFKNSDMLAPLL